MRRAAIVAAMVVTPLAVQAQSCDVPSAAGAAGYTSKTFGGSPVVGQNWLPSSPSGTGVSQTVDGSVTIANPTNNNWGGQLQTWNNGQGAAFGGGFYTQATLSWSGDYIGGQNGTAWPAFWADGQEAMTSAAAHTSWIEPDFMEAWGNNNWSGTLHSWAGGGASNIQTSSGGITTPGFNPEQPQTYGFLWVPATATSQGKAQWFLNDEQVGKTVTWNQGEGPYSQMDAQHFALFLGTGSNPMTVYDVSVWQNPTTANNIGASAVPMAAATCSPQGASLPTPTPPPVTPPSPPPPSPLIGSDSGAVVDCQGNAWSIGDGRIMEGTTPVEGGGDSSALKLVGCQVYGKDNGDNGHSSPNPGGWFRLGDKGWDSLGAGVPPDQVAAEVPPPISCPVAATATGRFHVADGVIMGPDGQPFIARGINVYDFDADSAASAMPSVFKGLNFVRVNIHSYKDPSSYQAFVSKMTAAGIVVEFEDHPDGGGGQDASPPNGIAAESIWYANMAAAYANNAYVWFGTFNEPGTSGGPISLSQWQRATYDAIRGAGNHNPILIETAGSRSWNLQQALSPGMYADMTNIVWDMHIYGYQVDYSTDQTTLVNNITAMAAAAQTIKSADGIVPVIIGEYGNSTDGTNQDSNGDQNVAAVVNAGSRQANPIGSVAWAWNPGGNADHLLDGSGQPSITFGQSVALYINTDVKPPSACMIQQRAQQAVAQATAAVQ